MSGNGTPRRLRIAVLNRIFSPTGGGAERYSIALVEQLAQRHEIHVFAQAINHQWPGVHYLRIPQPLTRPRWLNQLWFAVATWWYTRRGFDVVHSHENTWHGQVQTVHVVPVRYSLLHGRTGVAKALRWLKIVTSPRLLTYLALERGRYAVADGRCITLASSSQLPVMAEAFPHAVTACEVVNPGVSSVPGVASAQARAAARIQLGLPLDGRCVLFVGNDFRKKGLPTMLQALAQVPADCYLAVVGNLAQKPLVEADLQASGQSGRVHFLGALSSVDLAYQAADCLAHPTLEDTFAMVVLEALSHGLPVVVSGTPYCGIAADLRDGEEALLLSEPRDAQALATALLRVLDDAPLAARLREHGLAFAHRHLWSQIAVQQEALYQRLAALR
ncbi:MAG: glycosyltransferase family 4 protein [Burkholderiales bacterium]|nr:glycosyltransferase family 4 protein [Burkholderiales bacterium]